MPHSEDMVTDYFTKPRQGSLFVKLRNYIIGAEYGDGDLHTHRSALNEVDYKSHLDGNSERKISGCEVIVGTTSNCLPTSVPILPILLRAILYFVQYLYSFLPIVRLFYLTRYLLS